MATIYVDSNATGADDGTSWADAFDTLQEALSTWGATSYADGDQIWVAHNNAESYGASQILTATNDSITNPVVIVSVNTGTDAYDPQARTGGNVQFTTTGGAYDLSMDFTFIIYGLKFDIADDIFLDTTGGVATFVDCAVKFGTDGSGFFQCAATNTVIKFINGDIDCSTGENSFDAASYGSIIFEGTGIHGTFIATGVFQGSRGSIIRLSGCDLTDVLNTGGGAPTFFDASSAGNVSPVTFTMEYCILPASINLTDDSYSHPLVTAEIHSSDDSHDLWRHEKHNYYGTVISSDTQTHSGGYADIDDDKAISHLMTPRGAQVGLGTPLEGINLQKAYKVSGSPPDSKTITLYLYHDYTALTTKDFWMKVFFCGTSGEVLWEIDTYPVDPVTAGSSITASSWQSITASISIEETCTIRVVPQLGKYESGKVVYVDPRFTIT